MKPEFIRSLATLVAATTGLPAGVTAWPEGKARAGETEAAPAWGKTSVDQRPATGSQRPARPLANISFDRPRTSC